MRLIVLVLPLALILAACATLSEDQCRGGNWAGIGALDGEAGRAPDWIARHAEACADFGIQPDREAWAAGRAEGLVLYCQPARAYRIGRSGARISSVCPAAARAKMQTPWEHGRQYYRLEQDIDQIDREIDEAFRKATVTEDAALRDALLRDISFLRFRQGTLEHRQARYSSWP
ncbi:MAG: DUF2799 domain-containing protein [Pseudomonadota bacterium]